jgi:hypothetical protein
MKNPKALTYRIPKGLLKKVAGRLLPFYPLCRKLVGAQGRYGRVQKISPQPGFDPLTVQSVTALAIPASYTVVWHEGMHNELGRIGKEAEAFCFKVLSK